MLLFYIGCVSYTRFAIRLYNDRGSGKRQCLPITLLTPLPCILDVCDQSAVEFLVVPASQISRGTQTLSQNAMYAGLVLLCLFCHGHAGTEHSLRDLERMPYYDEFEQIVCLRNGCGDLLGKVCKVI